MNLEVPSDEPQGAPKGGTRSRQPSSGLSMEGNAADRSLVTRESFSLFSDPTVKFIILFLRRNSSFQILIKLLRAVGGCLGIDRR